MRYILYIYNVLLFFNVEIYIFLKLGIMLPFIGSGHKCFSLKIFFSLKYS